MQVQEHILPSKYPKVEDDEIVEEEYVEEQVLDEDQNGASGHFIMDQDIPEEMNDVSVIFPEGQNSVSIIREL